MEKKTVEVEITTLVQEAATRAAQAAYAKSMQLSTLCGQSEEFAREEATDRAAEIAARFASEFRVRGHFSEETLTFIVEVERT